MKGSAGHQTAGSTLGFIGTNVHSLSLIDMNPISQYYEVGNIIGSAGPELAWKIFEAVRKADKK
ncbi:SCY1-like protein 2, partial [Dinothrombium tinctorium]